jgi:GNAT superfamily N-acetyltransferase
MCAEPPAHPLAQLLDDAARGRFPPANGELEVLPSTGGRADAWVLFTAHFVLAADVPRDEVLARLGPDDFSATLSPSFLSWLGERTRRRPGVQDALLCAVGDGSGAPDWLVPADDREHPRVQRAVRYRDDISVHRTHDGDGVVVVGRGLCGRWEVAYEVEPGARGRGLGRRLVAAARGLVPAGTPLWAQVTPANAASLRATLAAGFVPVGAEVLLTRH